MSTDDLIGALRFAPDGLTTAELAARFGADPATLSMKLSRLANYGRIDRAFETRTRSGAAPQRWCRWSIREQARAD